MWAVMTTMKIKPIASSSAGNCYVIDDGATRLMIDCGIPIKDIKVATNFLNPPIDGCLVSHSHKDHSRSVENLLMLGISCYMSNHTISALDAKHIKSPFVQEIRAGEKFAVGSFVIQPLEVYHDVPCLGFYILSTETRETLFFATDTYMIPYSIPNLDYIMVEANYDETIIDAQIERGGYDGAAKERLMKSHMEIGSLLRWLEGQDLRRCRRIYLLHLSSGSSDEADFKQRVMEATGVPVTVCPA